MPNEIEPYEELVKKTLKVVAWLKRLQAQAEAQIKTSRFESLNDALRADARNYEAVRKDLEKTLDKIGLKR